jgi:hypothetical protein
VSRRICVKKNLPLERPDTPLDVEQPTIRAAVATARRTSTKGRENRMMIETCSGAGLTESDGGADPVWGD